MRSVIIVHPSFDRSWPWAADHFHTLWQMQGPVDFVRQEPDDQRSVSRIVAGPTTVKRLVVLGAVVEPACAAAFTGLREMVLHACHVPRKDRHALAASFAERGVIVHEHGSEGFWGQSVAEFGLALTLCGLRRIPQTHHAILGAQQEWNYEPPGGIGRPGQRGHQYGDDSSFTNGTLAGKRVRIVGAGNIASRYASFCTMLGAEVAAWDPYASEPCFHRAGSRREHHLDRLGRDAEIYVPMVPLSDKTRGLVTAPHIEDLPRGCLVVLVTRANICDMATLRRRVLADELALAADVFDVEPLPLDDPLLGRPNVVHTPHNAGRTRQANEAWARMLVELFAPVPAG